MLAPNGVAAEAGAPAKRHDDIVYPSAIPFTLVHLACLVAIWTGITWQAVAIGAALYWIRIFAIGAGVSIYEGYLHIVTPEPLADPLVNYIVLGVAALAVMGYDGWLAMECGVGGDPHVVLPEVARFVRGHLAAL